MLRWLAEIDPDDPEVGGKAAGLARLLAAGLDVPDGFVVPASAYRAAVAAADAPLPALPLPAELARAIAGAAVRLAAPLVVRSSATCEDRPGVALAPGVFRTVRDVGRPGAPTLEAAVRRVWASLLEEPARSYLAARGLRADQVAMAVLVQRQVDGAAAGTAYTRAPGSPQDVLIEAAGGRPGARPDVALVDRGSGATVVSAGALPDAAIGAIGRAALAAEAAIGEAADVEWVLADRLYLVQARPIGDAPGGDDDAAAWPADTLAFSRDEPGAPWSWDAVHNPEPLSPAQEGLVGLVEDARAAAVRQRVVEGFLFWTAHGAPAPRRTIAAADLARAYADDLRPAMERALERVEEARAPRPSLEDALAAYVDFYRVWAGVLAPALAAARRPLDELLLRGVGPMAAGGAAVRLLADAAAPPLEGVLVAVARGRAPEARLWELARPLAPVWDVAAPTYGEDPTPVRAALALARAAAGDDEARAADGRRAARDARLELEPRLSPGDRDALGPALEAARGATAIGEDDDLLFGRAQDAVRRALRGLAEAWGVPVDDLAHVPLADVRAAAAAGRPPAGLAARAAEGRATRTRRRALRPPLLVAAGRAVRSARLGANAAGVLRGRGTGGRLRGVVVRAVGELPPPDALGRAAVLVTATVTPAMAPLLIASGAVVAEHGGLLGHGAALARELGRPCVVGCAGALSLRNGEPVFVDGEAGLVVRG